MSSREPENSSIRQDGTWIWHTKDVLRHKTTRCTRPGRMIRATRRKPLRARLDDSVEVLTAPQYRAVAISYNCMNVLANRMYHQPCGMRSVYAEKGWEVRGSSAQGGPLLSREHGIYPCSRLSIDCQSITCMIVHTSPSSLYHLSRIQCP